MIDYSKPLVCIHIDKDGNQEVLFHGDVALVTVDERSPSDRVYLHTIAEPLDVLASIIGDSPIGHANDERHPALKARILGEGFTIIDGGKKHE